VQHKWHKVHFAIQTTLCGLRAKVGNKNIVAILELRSNTMKSGVHQQSLVDALSEANPDFIVLERSSKIATIFLLPTLARKPQSVV
jgi:UDP-N-acetylmuramate-alanine ligase